MMLLDELVISEYAEPMEPAPDPRDLLVFVRTLKNPQGEFQGQFYEPTMHPGQIAFLLAFITAKWKNFVIVADTQSGKSWLIQCLLFYATCELKYDVLYGLPDMRFVSDVWHKKIKEGLVGSGLQDRLPRSGSGSGEGTDIETVYLNKAGSINFQGSGGRNKGGGNDGRTLPWIFNDEFDTIPRHVINKNERRADSFFRRARRFRSSTIKDDDDSHILSAYENSVKAHLVFRCVHCQRFTPLEWEQVVCDYESDGTVDRTARIACAQCNATMTETERQAVLRDSQTLLKGQRIDDQGAIVGDIDESETYGIRYSALDNPFKTLAFICKLFRAATLEFKQGRTQDLIDFYHDQLVRQYPRENVGEDVDATKLIERSASATYQRGVVPRQVIFTTVAVDQQKRVLAYLVKGHDHEGRTWRCEWGYEDICGARSEPTPQQRAEALARLDKRLMDGLPRQDSHQVVRPVIIGVDVADWPGETAAWVRENRRWLALHGTGAEQVKRMSRGEGVSKKRLTGWYDLRTQKAHGGEWDIMWFDSDSVKHEVTRSFARKIGDPASAMLPAGLKLDSDLILHLTSERWQKTPDRKGFSWVHLGYRFNDFWDCDYYTQALGQYWLQEFPNYTPPSNSPGRPLGPSGGAGDDFGSHMGSW